MPDSAEGTPRKPLGSARRVLLAAAVLVVLGVLAWLTASRIRELHAELAASEKRAAELNERLRQHSLQLQEAIERARAARTQADTAQKRAEETETALRQTEHLAETVAAERARAVEDASAARSVAARTQEELEAIRRRREAELDRMQEALNRIAPTKRTPAGMVMTLSDEHFRFDFDKAALRAENREMLSRIAGILLASEGYRLFVDGHTDDIGDATYNQGLSERRAQAVRDYLVQAGVPADVIEMKGFGKTQPLVDARTAQARARNRRVEIGIVDTIIHYEKAVRN